MSVYLDASVLVPLFIDDTFTERAEAILARDATSVIVGDFAAAELASAIARKVRERRITAVEARAAFSTFDAWTARMAKPVETMSTDITGAAVILRRLDLPLRTPDALHLAIAQRLGAALATFDAKMAVSARQLDLPLADG